tara:strand:- start:315 stop:575 length:261 start_codon:yes stop_codon:yes gene_type:complete
MTNPTIGQKFKLGDPVVKVGTGGTPSGARIDYGKILKAIPQANKVGRVHWYYEVKFDSGRVSRHGQNRLSLVPQTPTAAPITNGKE